GHAVAEAGQGHRVDVVAAVAQAGGDVAPRPAAEAGAGDEDERPAHLSLDSKGHAGSISYCSSPMTTTRPSPWRAASAKGVSPSATGKRTSATLRPPS